MRRKPKRLIRWAPHFEEEVVSFFGSHAEAMVLIADGTMRIASTSSSHDVMQFGEPQMLHIGGVGSIYYLTSPQRIDLVGFVP